MADSIVYGGIMGSIFATLPAQESHVPAFDTEVLDLTGRCADPVDLLFALQLGGTDINRAIAYGQTLVHDPRRTLFMLVSDLHEGDNARELASRMEQLVGAGMHALCLLALNDSGLPAHDENMVLHFVDAGVPCFGCRPSVLPTLLEGILKGNDLAAVAERCRTAVR